MGEAAYVLFKSKYNIICFCDNDKDKWGKKFCGLEIIPPENLKTKELSNVNIIIASMYSKEIQNQLIEYGVKKERIQLADFKVESFLKNLYEDNECKSLKNMIDSFRKSKDYNLHIMPDSVYSKSFIEFVNLHFNKDEHKFIILTDFKIELEYMDNIDSFENVEVIYYNKYAELKLYFYVKSSKRLFVHYLTDYMCKFINDYEVWNETELNWIIWGGDLYEYIDLELYDDMTREIMKYEYNYDKNIFLKNYYEKDNGKYRIETIKKIDNIMTVCEEDYNIIKKHFHIRSEMRRFFYPNPLGYKNIKISLNQQYNFKRKFNYIILLGNSGDPCNNHIDILYELKKFKDKNFCILCPLSYGDESYIRYVIKIGTELFEDKFIPLTEFLHPSEYYYILNQVDVAIMNHRRQQAVSNILALIYLRKKIYMKDMSPFNMFLNNINIITFSTDLLRQSSFEEIVNYSNNTSIKNKSKLIEYFNEKNCIELWKSSFRH